MPIARIIDYETTGVPEDEATVFIAGSPAPSQDGQEGK